MAPPLTHFLCEGHFNNFITSDVNMLDILSYNRLSTGYRPTCTFHGWINSPYWYFFFFLLYSDKNYINKTAHLLCKRTFAGQLTSPTKVLHSRHGTAT